MEAQQRVVYIIIFFHHHIYSVFLLPSAVPLREESSISSLRRAFHLPIVYGSILLDILSKFELKKRIWSLPVRLEVLQSTSRSLVNSY